MESLFFPEDRKRYEERCPKVTQPLISTVVKKALALQGRQHLVLCRLLAPRPIPPNRRTLAPKLMWLPRQRLLCLLLSSGQNCGHYSLQRVLENGRINRVATDHLGAHLQDIVRTPSRLPVPVLEKRQARLSRRQRHPQLDANLHPTPRSRCHTGEASGIRKKTDWKNETVSFKGPS
jgi:hypothetical protein